MKYLILLTFLSSAAFATCMMEKITCLPNNNFQNVYSLTTVSCSPPGGPVHKTKMFEIKNPLTFKCSPVGKVGCDAPILKQEVNENFQVELKYDQEIASLKIDDSRMLPQGMKQISTSKSKTMILENYKCLHLFN